MLCLLRVLLMLLRFLLFIPLYLISPPSSALELPLVNALSKVSLSTKIIKLTRTTQDPPLEGLLSTDFLKDSHAYVRDMEKRSGLRLVRTQKSELKRALREGKFKKLKSLDYIRHKKEYSNSRSKLILEWGKYSDSVWPKSPSKNWKTGKIEIFNHQFHHIIPQEFGGPNVWWNGHPLKGGREYHGGVHGKGSPLNKMIDELREPKE